jgi:Skp family chaperone for outer membrane proteins
VNKSNATLAICVLVGAMGVQALAQNGNNSTIKTTSATSQPNTPTVAPSSLAPVRVAVLNTNKVLKNFNKAQQLNDYISKKVNYYGAQINAKREEGAKLAEQMKLTVNPTEADQIKKRVTQLEREMQDLDAEARKDISAQQGTAAVEIYKNIEDVVSRVAAANGFDLVISYPDATTDADMYSQPNIMRKLASQGSVPLYYKRHIDLSDAVVQTLNATYPAPPPPVTPASATAPASTPTNAIPTSNPKK